MYTRRIGAIALTVVCLSSVVAAQEQIDIQNWPAPPYWAPPAQPQRDAAEGAPTAASALEPSVLPTEPLPFIAIAPCRLIDTRNPVGTYGGPPLVVDTPRSFPVAGQCGVAANAEAVSVNVTVTNTQGGGWVALYPAGSPWPGVSTVNYPTSWVSVANAAIVPLGGGGFTALAAVSATDLIVDVNGYYAPAGVRSVFGRTGNVVGAAGDYTANQVTNLPAGGITATDVQGALDGLDTGKAGIVHTHSGSEIAGLTSGGITFGNASGSLAQSSSQLFWDQANNRLGIGTASPAHQLDLTGMVNMPATTATSGTPTAGVLFFAGQRFLHAFDPIGARSNTFLGIEAGNFTMGGAGEQGRANTGIGFYALRATTTGRGNTAVGNSSLTGNMTGDDNTSVGWGSLSQNTTGSANTAIGHFSLNSNIEGTSNTALGLAGLLNNTGSSNIALGKDAGFNLTTGSYNIDIGNQGVADEGNTIRIGTPGDQNRTFVAGIRGVTPGSADGLPVIIDSNGQLGTSTSVGAVTSVFGRTGAVTAQAGDYAASQVSNAPAGNISSTTAQAAVNELDAEKAALAHSHTGSQITGLTSGGVTFGNASGSLAQDANQLYWDQTNRRLGLGTSAPQQQLELTGMMRMPATAATAGTPTAGVLYLGTDPFLHNYPPGADNTFVGEHAGNFSMTGINNTGIGNLALNSTTTGGHNTAIGHLTLTSNTEGNDNTSVGSVSLYQNTVGSANTAAGYHSLYANTAASRNTAVGKDSLYTQSYDNGGTSWDSDNTAVGYQALYTNDPTSTTNGNANTAVGSQSLYSNTTGKANTAVGIVSLYSTDTGSENTALGYQALYGNLGGSYNIGIGYGGGSLLTTGSSNIAIGNYGVAGESNTIRIGSAPNQTRAFIAGITGANVGTSSAVYVNAAGQLGTVQSSIRYKQDVQDMGETSTRLLELRPVTFHYRNDPEGPLQYGLIAEEVEQVLPELVVHDATGRPETVAYHELPTMLLNELQKQHAIIQAQEAQIEALMARLEALEAHHPAER